MNYVLKYNDDQNDTIDIDGFDIASVMAKDGGKEESLRATSIYDLGVIDLDACNDMLGKTFTSISIIDKNTNILIYNSNNWNRLTDVYVTHNIINNKIEITYTYRNIL